MTTKEDRIAAAIVMMRNAANRGADEHADYLIEKEAVAREHAEAAKREEARLEEETLKEFESLHELIYQACRRGERSLYLGSNSRLVALLRSAGFIIERNLDDGRSDSFLLVLKVQ